MSFRIKEILTIACLLAFILFINHRESYIDVSVQDIYEQVYDDMDMTDMSEFGYAEIKKNFGFNINDYGTAVYYGHETVMRSECLFILKLNDENMGASIVDTIDGKRKELAELFKSYAIDQYELLSNSVLIQKGEYIIYVVSEDADDVYKEFLKVITG